MLHCGGGNAPTIVLLYYNVVCGFACCELHAPRSSEQFINVCTECLTYYIDWLLMGGRTTLGAMLALLHLFIYVVSMCVSSTCSNVHVEVADHSTVNATITNCAVPAIRVRVCDFVYLCT